MKKLYFILLIFCLSTVIYAQSDSIIILKNESDLLFVGKQTYFLEDQEGKLSLEDILKPENQAKFQRHDKDVFNKSATKSSYWLKISVQNHSQKEAWLELGSSYLSQIDFYRFENNQYQLITQTGWLRPENSKAYPSNLYWLPLSQTQSQTVYVSVQTKSLIEIPLKVGTILSLSQQKAKNDYWVGGFVGIMLAMFAYNLFLFLGTRDSVYIPYLGYILSVIFTSTFVNSYPIITFFVSDSYRPLFYLYNFVWFGIPFVFAGFFSIYFLNLEKKEPFFKKLMFFNIVILGVLIPIICFFQLLSSHLLTIIYQLVLLFYILCVLLIGAYLWLYKKDKNAFFYTLAWVWVVLGVIFYILSVNGILPYHIVFRNAMFFGSGMEVLFFSFALANRINMLNKEKEKAKAKVLELMQNQKIILEKAVQQRTEDIDKQKKELSSSLAQRKAITDALDNSSIVSIADLKGKIVKINPLFCQISGYTEAELLGQDHRIVNSGNHSKEFWIDMWKTISKGNTWRAEVCNRTKNGELYWVDTVINPVYDENGKIYQYFSIRTLVTDRKNAERQLVEKLEELHIAQEKLQINESVLKGLIESQTSFVLRTDLEGHYTYVNKKFIEVFGYIHGDSNKIIGKHCMNSICAEDHQKVVEGIGRLLANPTEIIQLDIKKPLANGKNADTLWDFSCITDTHGKPIEIQCVGIDYTARKEAEEALKESEEKLQSILNEVQDVIWSVSLPDYHTLFVSTSVEKLYGIGSEEWFNDNQLWCKLIHPEDREIVRQITNSLQTQGSSSAEYRIITKEGAVRWISNKAKFISDKNGTLFRIDGVTSDITARKEAEQTIQIQNRELQDSLAQVIMLRQKSENSVKELNATLGIVSKQRDDIISSINYALRIQKAIIPSEAVLQNDFDCFVFYRPKNIVSGDFYWFADKGKTKIFALADCTGHGVSGAFMTMIGINILNQTVKDYGIVEVNEILNKMPVLLGKILRSMENSINDGMDIAVLMIDQEKHTVECAAAKMSLYYAQNGTLETIKGDRMAIYGKTEENSPYTKHTIQLNSDEWQVNSDQLNSDEWQVNSDQLNSQEQITHHSTLITDHSSLATHHLTLYLCSDGFQDQFGGENSRRFMTKNLKALFETISDKPMAEQGEMLEQTFDEWKGEHKQTDDVLVVGIRL